MADDISNNIAVVVALGALAFSLITWRQQAKKDRRDLYLQINERLIDADLQRGRGALNSREGWTAERFARLRDHDPDEHQLINRALAMFDVFALYVERKYIDEDIALEQWGHTIARSWKNAVPFIEARERHEGYRPWRAFRTFGPRVEAWVAANPRD